MGFIAKYPYTDFHELNLDYLLQVIKSVETTLTDFVSLNVIKYADPIQWSITRQYEKNTVVIDPLTGTAYISVAPVPIGAALTRPEYWTVVFDLEQFVTKASENFANTYEAQTTTTATQATPQYGWIVWGGILYVANTAITPGDAYVVGGNITRITVEDICGHIETLNTTDKSNLVAAINEVLATLISTAGDLSQLSTVDQSNLVAAINEVITTMNSAVLSIQTDMGDLATLSTTDKSSLVNAINEVFSDLGSAVLMLQGITGDLADLNTTDKDSLVDAINEVLSDVGNAVSTLEGITGDLADLNTTDKDSLVDAINEVVGNIGDLTLLLTTDKTSLVNAINELVNISIVNDNTVTPEMFGAVGDGVTDDVVAIQAAMDTKKHVLFMNKTYYISAPLVLASNMWLTGQNTTITCAGGFITTDKTNIVLDSIVENLSINGSNTGICIDLEIPLNTDAYVVDTNFNNLRIRNFTIGIKTQYSWTDNFYRVRVIHCDQAFVLRAQSNNMNFYGCHFNADTAKNTITNSYDINFDGCSIENSMGIYVIFSTVTLKGCYIEAINDVTFARVGQLSAPDQFNNLSIIGCKSTLGGTPLLIRNDSYAGNSKVTVLASENFAVVGGYGLKNQNNIRSKSTPLFALGSHNMYRTATNVGDCDYKMVDGALYARAGQAGDIDFNCSIPADTPIRIDLAGYGEGVQMITVLLLDSSNLEIDRIRIPIDYVNNTSFATTNEMILSTALSKIRIAGIGSDSSNYLGYIVVSELGDNNETIARLNGEAITVTDTPTFTADDGTTVFSITDNAFYYYLSGWNQVGSP